MKKSLIHTIKKPEKDIYIYGLAYPDTEIIFYIGLATTGFRRMEQHYRCGLGKYPSNVKKEIDSLRKQGKIFKPIYLEYFDNDGFHVDESEIFWIGNLRMLGNDLLNHDMGGRANYLNYSSFNSKYNQSIAMKKVWSNENFKNKFSNIMSEINGTPEKIEFFKNHTTETWKDPEIRARRIAGLQGPKSKEHVEKVKKGVTKTCGTHVEDEKGNFFPSLSECARFYNLDVGTIRRILYATTRKYAHIKLKRVGGAGKDSKDMHIDCSYIPVAERNK